MRGKKAIKRKISQDIKYSSINVEKFINRLMKDGKKSLAREIVYNALEKSSNELKENPLNIFDKVIDNVSPSVEVKSRRLGGANYQVPVPVSPDRQVTLAIRWIITAARDKKGMPLEDRLTREFVDAFNNTGAAIKKKTDIEKMAESNKAFSHLA